MVSRKVVVRNETGLHLRPAGVLCNLAEQFQSSIRFQTGGGASGGNAKSVLSVLGACIRHGDELEFICEGADEAEALKAVVDAVEQGLGEELSH
ncbi:MAG: HPr family phosphocarrier protein [bacterium]|nr:HPr family phosphocarrier protein [bacterium]